jgi:hypothetical protein
VIVTEADGSLSLWVYDVASAAGLRLTQEGVTNTPVWIDDGRLAFTFSVGVNALFTVAADGSGGPELLLPVAQGLVGDFPTSVTPDGRHVIFSRPDGRWLVYRSNQSGQMEVYVQPYPGPGPTVPVSIGGGTDVAWSPDGSELLYRLDDRMMSVSLSVDGDTPRIGPPRELFSGDYYATAVDGSRQFHVAPDGRFLMLKDVASQSAMDQLPPQVILVQNFFEELRRVVPE